MPKTRLGHLISAIRSTESHLIALTLNLGSYAGPGRILLGRIFASALDSGKEKIGCHVLDVFHSERLTTSNNFNYDRCPLMQNVASPALTSASSGVSASSPT